MLLKTLKYTCSFIPLYNLEKEFSFMIFGKFFFNNLLPVEISILIRILLLLLLLLSTSITKYLAKN